MTISVNSENGAVSIKIEMKVEFEGKEEFFVRLYKLIQLTKNYENKVRFYIESGKLFMSDSGLSKIEVLCEDYTQNIKFKEPKNKVSVKGKSILKALKRAVLFSDSADSSLKRIIIESSGKELKIIGTTQKCFFLGNTGIQTEEDFSPISMDRNYIDGIIGLFRENIGVDFSCNGNTFSLEQKVPGYEVKCNATKGKTVIPPYKKIMEKFGRGEVFKMNKTETLNKLRKIQDSDCFIMFGDGKAYIPNDLSTLNLVVFPKRDIMNILKNSEGSEISIEAEDSNFLYNRFSSFRFMGKRTIFVVMGQTCQL